MIVCGVDIASKTASLVIVKMDDEKNLSHLGCGTKKISLTDDTDATALINLSKTIQAFAHQHGIERFVIKTRQSKGLMASAGVTFKIEALFQISGTPVEFVSPQSLVKFKKTNHGAIPSTILKYQEDAYLVAAFNLYKK